MSIESPHTSGLFAELLEGAKALAERPDLIARADKAEAERDWHASRTNDMRQQVDAANARIAELTAALAAKEADLAQATFQHKEVGDKLALILDAAKGIMGNIGAAVELVEPKPEPVYEPGVPTSAPSAETNGGASTTTDASTTDGVTDLPGTAPSFRGPLEHPGPELVGQSEPEEVSGNSPAPVPFVGTSTPYASSEPSPSGTAQSTTTSESAQTSDAETPAVASSPSFAGQEYWRKPDNVTWDNWIANGGEAPPWKKQAAQ